MNTSGYKMIYVGNQCILFQNVDPFFSAGVGFAFASVLSSLNFTEAGDEQYCLSSSPPSRHET